MVCNSLSLYSGLARDWYRVSFACLDLGGGGGFRKEGGKIVLLGRTTKLYCRKSDE